MRPLVLIAGDIEELDGVLKVALTNAAETVDVAVTNDGALLVAQVPPAPEPGTENRIRYLNQRLQNGGSADMRVDGSTTPITFSLGSAADHDRYITELLILIADRAISNNKFGGLKELINGVSVRLTEAGVSTDLITAAKTVGELQAEAGRAGIAINNWSGKADAITVRIPVGEYVTGGLRIGQQSADLLTAIVSDDLTGLDVFEIRALGYQSYQVTT